MSSTVVGLSDIVKAANRLKGSVHRTPVLTSTALDQMTGYQLYFKCENFQKTGSFKARGALNALKCDAESRLATNEKPVAMVVTHSSGNHGQAVAWAARHMEKPCTVVVPRGTPKVKCDAIEGYGATLVFCDPTPTSRKETADAIVEKTGGLLIHPYDNYNVIAGQATIGHELLTDVADLDVILVPISGGGMTSGIALAARELNPKCKVIAVEPKGKDLARSLAAKERLWPNPPQFLDTIAEGIMTQQVGQLTFPILCSTVGGVITVTNSEMATGCRVVAERMKLMVEAASGAAIAAAMSPQLEQFCPKGGKVGVILCGGNVDLNNLPWLMKDLS